MQPIPARSHIVLRYSLVLILALTSIAIPYGAPVASAANPSGDLTITPIAAYNFIVDSNVESPSTYAPEAATIGARFCNTGANDLTDVFAYVGNFDPNGDSNPADSTPGVYQSVTNPPTGQVGTFALQHEGGSAGLRDATRYVPRVPAGQCVTQYWLISYPRLDANGETVTRGVKPSDDLVLSYDIWARATDGAASLTADVARTATMRNEISAAANKIWPNGDNKVPDVYKQAITDVLGWDTLTPSGGTTAYPGETVTTQGIWYDLGNVGAGFDNNGDGLPDYNAWVQPIGDPDGYDPGCFRLVRTYGIIIVKLVGGGEKLIPFVDNTYFQNIPANTGAVGLVYYQYAALDGACTARISPYQEVASGYDNEKFNGDYGYPLPPLQSRTPSVAFTKGVDATTISSAPTVLNYTLTFKNTASEPSGFEVSVGDPSLGTPLVVSDIIPNGSSYVANSATAVGASVSPAGVKVASIRYSTDDGATWTTTQPAAASVTNVQWWMDRAVPQGDTVTLGFSVDAPQASPTASAISVIPNTAGASFGEAPPFATADATTLVLGDNSLSGNVFGDTGAGSSFASGAFDAGESRIPNVTVSLYLDSDGDGAGDLLIGSTSPSYTGAYSFGSLADGSYEVRLDTDDPDIPAGLTNTTPTERLVALDPGAAVAAPVSQANIDFGFASALSIDKALVGSSPIYEGDLVQYTIRVSNRLPGDGSAASAPCTYTAWASAESPWTIGQNAQSDFTGEANAFGAGGPNGSYAFSDYANTTNYVAGRSFALGGQGGITRVEALFSAYKSGSAFSDDTVVAGFFYDPTPSALSTGTTPQSSLAFTNVTLNALNGAANQATLSWDITALRPSWTFSDFAGAVNLRIATTKVGSKDNAVFNLDAIGLRVTTDANCGPTPETTLDPAPLTDTYDAARLEFVSATPGVDGSGAGTLSWSNVGPLYPGQTKTITTTFRVLTPASQGQSATNTAAIVGASYVSGRPASDVGDPALAAVNYTGSIGGRVFKDAGSNGWQGSAGHDAGDIGIPGVTVALYGCYNTGAAPAALIVAPAANKTCAQQTGGAWVLVDTQITDASGDYLFDGLRDGYYLAEVVDGGASVTGAATTSTLPGGVAQTAEASDSQAPGAGFTCPTCNGVWGSPATNLDAGFNPIDTPDEAIANVSFGYSVPTTIYGAVWDDANADGDRDPGEGPLAGATVYLCTSTPCNAATPGAVSVTTDANGTYRFSGIGAGTYYVGVVPVGGWANTADPSAQKVGQSGAISVSAGDMKGPYDFGYQQTGPYSIGDTLYYDWDGDAAQDSGDEGVAGVPVSLYKDANGDGQIDPQSDPLIGTTTTGADGKYLFPGLPNGSYIVVLDRADPDFPAGFTATQDPDQSGLCTLCDGRAATTLSGASDLTNDFGYRPIGAASIGDTVWYDRNGDGVQSGVQELGIAGVTVLLQADLNGDGSYVTIMSASTDADGEYLFEGLPDATYRVVVDTADPQLPDDAFGNAYVPTTVVQHEAVVSGDDVTSLNGLACAGCSTNADFGFTALGAIGDVIFWDANGNGQQDWNEAGVAGATVTLYRDVDGDGLYTPGTDTAYGAPAQTGADGDYLFSGLPASRYVVVSTPPSGSTLTADPSADGAPCTAPGAVGCDGALGVRVLPGASFMGADFGYQPPGVIGDVVWNDLNNNGAQDAGEPGISGVTVSVYNDVNGSGLYEAGTDTLYGAQATDPDGGYIFSGVPNGSYVVVVDSATLPASYTQTGDPDAPGAPCAAACNSQSAAVISAGGVDLAEDFGYRLSGALSLSGTICFDDPSDNGLCGGTSGELPLEGQTVYLTTATGALVGIATTSAGGAYSFGGLPAGSYRVAIGTSAALFTGASLTTTTAHTAVTSIATTAASATQSLTLSGSRTGVDFAFRRTAVSDFGDLPLSYSTVLGGAPDGARHLVAGNSGLYLGSAPDAELDGQPGALASGDGADEDGVTISAPWIEGAAGGQVSVSVAGSGYLAAWVDFNHNGSFADPGEMVIGKAIGAGAAAHSFNIPAGALGAPLAARFRLFDAAPVIPALAYAGEATAGEVEDYILFAQMQIDKDTSTPLVLPGGQASYSIRVTNSGTLPLSGVTVSDSLPPGFTFASAGIVESAATRTAASGPAAGAASLAWGTWQIDAGGSVAITFVADVSSAALGVYDNTAAASSLQTGAIDDDGLVAQDGGTPSGADPETDEDVSVQTTLTYTIGDKVWNDANNDGQLGAGELPLAGVVVNLYADANGDGTPDSPKPIQTTTTSPLGAYAFSGLSAGGYVVGLDPAQFAGGAALDGFVSSSGTPMSGGAEAPVDANNRVDGDDNGVAVAGWGILSSSLAVGGATSVDTSIDFGLLQEARLGSLIWLDADEDGIHDPGELGAAGVTVTLYNSAGAAVAVATTDNKGGFLFTHLTPGAYSLGVSKLPSGYTFTLRDQGSDASDSDVDAATGRTASIVLGAGQHNLTLFAGLARRPVTAITLTSLTVSYGDDGALVRWSTGAEINTAGFRVLRGTTDQLADAAPVSGGLIVARGNAGRGASYSWADASARPGQRYWYWLEEVEIGGAAHPYGPATAPSLTGEGTKIFIPMIVR